MQLRLLKFVTISSKAFDESENHVRVWVNIADFVYILLKSVSYNRSSELPIKGQNYSQILNVLNH